MEVRPGAWRGAGVAGGGTAEGLQARTNEGVGHPSPPKPRAGCRLLITAGYLAPIPPLFDLASF
jgi:hypothetical protein